MSLIEQIKRAWEQALKIVASPKQTYKDMSQVQSLEQEFMIRLNRIPTGMDVIVTRLYSNYAGSKSSLDMISKDYDKLEEEHHKLKDQCDELEKDYKWENKKRNFLVIERDKLLLVGKHNQEAYDSLQELNTKQIELSNDLLDQRDDLESALNTSRYFIFLSGMCGFLLGLACLYFVV